MDTVEEIKFLPFLFKNQHIFSIFSYNYNVKEIKNKNKKGKSKMTIKQYYLNMIKEGMMEGDERKIQYYEKELNELGL